MANKVLLLNQGKVASKASVMLGEGELHLGEDAEYLVGDPAIYSVRGAFAFNDTPAAGAIRGGGFAEFDRGDDVIVVGAGSTYQRARAIGLAGTFSNFTGVGSPTNRTIAANGLTDNFQGNELFDMIHYDNKYVIVNGRDANRIFDKDGEMTYLGMRPNLTGPDLELDLDLTGFLLNIGQTIDYWIEERVKDANGLVIKRNASLENGFTRINGTGGMFHTRINRPTVLNRETTHWAVYTTGSGIQFFTGFELDEQPISTLFIGDTRTGTDPDAPGGAAYEVVSISLAGALTLFAKNGPPPLTSSTGDIWENALVLNDVSDKSLVVFSFFNAINSFPASNVMRMETKQGDEVRMIRAVGSVLLILMRDSVWKVFTLPQPEDAQFAVQRIKDQSEGAHGIVGPHAAALINLPGTGVRLAYVTPYGLAITDGTSWDILSDDAQWEKEFRSAAKINTHLVYNPEAYRLEMSYQTDAGIKVAFFHVHPSHLKFSQTGRPRAKAAWPINRNVLTLFKATIGELDYIMAGARDGKVYVCNRGVTNDMPGGTINFHVRTGTTYLQGVGGESKIERGWIHHNAVQGGVLNVSLLQHNENQDVISVPTSIKLDREEATTFFKEGLAEAIQVDMSAVNPPSQIRINFVVLNHIDAGLEMAD